MRKAFICIVCGSLLLCGSAVFAQEAKGPQDEKIQEYIKAFENENRGIRSKALEAVIKNGMKRTSNFRSMP